MEKINIAELLKDCPKGMELDCTMYENVTLVDVYEGYDFPIEISTPEGKCSLSQYGCYALYKEAKCVIFPKGKTTWEGFVPPCKFKEGDIVVCGLGNIHLLRTADSSYCAYRELWRKKLDTTITTDVRVIRFATEEEKQKLFNAIKANGYKWNAETKTLEKLPKFKVGDRIVKRNSISNPWIVSSVSSEYYELKLSKGSENIGVLPICEQDDYELVPNKFEITTLKPFEKVLRRDSNDDYWNIGFFSFKGDKHFCTERGYYSQCIPFEGNEHLLGTKNDCDEYFKTWEE